MPLPDPPARLGLQTPPNTRRPYPAFRPGAQTTLEKAGVYLTASCWLLANLPIGPPSEAVLKFWAHATMAVVETKPRILHGPWVAGFALDWHTLRSVPIGPNASGHMQFDTTRPPVGQLLYDLKYGVRTTEQKQGIANDLADTAARFVRHTWQVAADAIVPVPPSNSRAVQPVALVAQALAGRLGMLLCTKCVVKLKRTPQLKDIKDYHQRRDLLKDAFSADPQLCAGKTLLLFDDVHGSGATVGHIADVLKSAGAQAVYLLTLTTK